MDEKDWNMLVVLNEERNIRKASERLYLSQPALSYRMQQLEDFFQCKLFIRKSKGTIFTPQGEVIIQYATSMLKQMKNIFDTIQSMETEIKGTIKVGVSSTYGLYSLPDILPSYLEEYPNVNVHIVTGLSSEIEKNLQSGDIHVAIIRGEHHWHEKQVLLSTEKICLVSKGKVTIDQLPSLPFIHYKMDHYLQDLIHNWWNSTFNEPELYSMQVDNLETCKELVKMGLGYTILPDICLKKEQDLFIQPLIRPDGSTVTRKTKMYCRDSAMEFAAVKSFFDFFKGCYNRDL